MARGYDDAIDEESADLLGRAGFASELARLAVASPLGWSTRIGVYGRWGEGKTSVVRLSQRYLEGDGHITLEFNPWGCRSADEMIAVLASAILDAITKANIQLSGGFKRAARRAAGAVGTVVQKADDLPLGAASLAVGTAAKLSPWLTRWAKDHKEDIAKALEVIDLNRRLIVFVDDVDRLDPKLLPALLFAVHEVFAIPGMTFVVALDPGVVGAALTEYHRGFGDGLAFLEKIVQFPRWLPPVEESDLLRIAEADRRQHAPFVTPSVLVDNRDILPRNPRELRMLVRGLMPLRHAFSRHDPDELDQNLIILLACLRQRFPQTLLRFLQDEELLDTVAISSVDKKAADRFRKRARELAVLSNELSIEESGDRAARFEQLVSACVGRSMLWRAKHIRYHANLTDRPDAVTWKEFRRLMAAPPATSAALDEWISQHAKMVNAPVSGVARELFDCVVRYHGKTMDESATAGTAEAQADRVRRVADAVSLLQLLWFTSAQSNVLRTPQNLRAVVATFRHWAHFDLNANDREQRQTESSLLEEMIAVVDNPVECLALLEPWNYDDNERRAAALTDRITASLIERAAPTALDRFLGRAGISTMFRARQYASEYVLVQATPTWTKENRKKLIEFSVASPEVVAENLRLFVEALVEPASFSTNARTLLADRALVELWWDLITAVRWQGRFFRGLQQLRGRLEAGTALPSPTWWDEVQKLTANREVRPDQDESSSTPALSIDHEANAP